MKKFVPTILLLGAGLLTITPTVSACDVTEPGGIGLVCVDEYESGWGDQTCEDNGHGRDGYRGYARAPGVGGFWFDAWDYCYKSSFRESEGTNLYGSGGVIDVASVLLIVYTSEDDEGRDCYIVVDTHSPAGNRGTGIDCSPPA